MIIESQNKEFFINNPSNIHYVPFDGEKPNSEYMVISDSFSGSLLLGNYKNRGRASEVYEEIKNLTLKNKKYYLMPRE